MDTNPNIPNNDIEIDIKDLFMALWRRKVFIICITLIFGLLAGLFSKFVITPVYHSKLNIVINMPKIYHTKYGDFTLPITTNQQYIDLILSNDILLKTIEDMEFKNITLEGLRDKITIGTVANVANVEHNNFEVKVAASTPAEAKELAQTLFNNYVEFLDMMTIDNAINYFIDFYTVSLQSLKVTLESNQAILLKNEELLRNTPQTINQKEAMEEIQEITDITEFVVLENIINPNYTNIETNIISIKQSVIETENNIKIYSKYLEELDREKSKVLSYYETGNYEQLEDNVVSVTASNIYLPSNPVVPARKTSPSNMKNAVLGAFLGGVLAILIALIKEFWFNKD